MTLATVSPGAPLVVRDVGQLRALHGQWRSSRERIALVPTMGALHDGHVSLVRKAREITGRVIVSIFVNPAQFGPAEDFDRYPRMFEADAQKVQDAGADAIFAPDVATIYPSGFASSIIVGGPATAGLEDKIRPGHFDGVATIVAKLHILTAPDIAIYGEKDFQQLAVIRQMNRDLNLPVEIIGAPIIRAEDGLALSSRNAYLSQSDRATAPELYRVLCQCRDAITSGVPVGQALADGLSRLTEAGFKPDYLELRDAHTLAAADLPGGREARLLVAARLGATRLIDNIAVSAA